MKSHTYLLLIIAVCLSVKISAQTPQAVPYQAAARDNSGNLIVNQNISIRFTIHDASANGTIVYQESHHPTTNELGLFSINVGQGSLVTGSFSAIKWGTNAKYLQVELDAANGTNYTDMGTQQMLSVPYALHAANTTAILDSLVLRDSTGDVRMVMNPNSGTFKLMNNDTVWYSIEVNSPPKTSERLSNGNIRETGTSSNGDTYDITRNFHGGVIKSETIHQEPNGDLVTVTRENADDGTPLKIKTETYTHDTYDGNTLTTLVTDVEEYIGGVLITKTHNDGFTTTIEHYDPLTGLLISKEVKKPDVFGPTNTFRIEIFDSTGTKTAERIEDRKGQVIRVVDVPSGKQTTVKPGDVKVESPTASTTVKEDQIIIKVDTTYFKQFIDPVTENPTLERSDTAGNFPVRLTLEYNDIVADAGRFTVKDSSSSIRFDVSTDYPKLEMIPSSTLFITPAMMWWDPFDNFFKLDLNPPNALHPFGFEFDPDYDILNASASNIKLRLDYRDSTSSSIDLDLVDEEPKIEMSWWDPTGTTNKGLFRIYPESLDGSFRFSATDPLTSNSSGIHLIPSSSTMLLNGSVLTSSSLTTGGSLFVTSSLSVTGPASLSSLTLSSPLTLSGCTVNGTTTLTNGSSSLIVGPSSINLSAGPSVFTVTSTGFSWAGTVTLNQPFLASGGGSLSQGSDIVTVDGSGINLTGSSNPIQITSPYGVTLTNGATTTLSVGPSGLTLQGLSNWGGTVTVSSPSGITIPSGGLTAAGTVSAGSFSGDGGGITSLSASNITIGTLSDSRLSTNIPLLNSPNIFSGPISIGSGGCTITGSSILSGLTVSGPAGFSGPSTTINSGSNSFAVTPSGLTWAGTLSVTGSSTLTFGSSTVTLGSSDINLTSGSNSLYVSSSTGITAGGAVTVTSSSGISIPSGGLTASGTVSAGSLSGNGGSITLINGSNISTGTINDGRLSANIPRLNQPVVFAGPLAVNLTTPGQDAIVGVAFGQSPGAPSNLAGKFYGNVSITGNLTKGGGTFKIDHPLDPKNKYLYHSFVESPDMMNIYTGSIKLDENGRATVELPEWFESLNKDFHYQLTCIGGYAQVYIDKGISNNSFVIAGGKQGMKVSWQVTGVRHDPYAEKYRVVVEEEKPVEERGKYLHPEAFEENN